MRTTQARLTILSVITACVVAITPASARGQVSEGDSSIGAVVQPIAERALESGATAGLQVGVVFKDGRRWAGGFGVADMDSGRPVDVNSRFYIASTTKALTALAAARLHHRGEFNLDRPLADALPAGSEPEGIDGLTVRDLFTHTHGLRHGGISWRVAFTGEYTLDLFFEMLREAEASEDRSYRYTNFGYDIAGVLLAPHRKQAWKEVLQEEVMGPLGMTRTTAYVSRIPDDELAMPHEFGREGMARIRLGKADANMGPAGGHFSTATDLSRLLLAQMNSGVLDGEQIIEAEVIADTQRQQATQDREFIHYHRHGWGFGWDLGRYDGELVVHRPGGFAGYYSNAAFLPEHGFGVVVLANGGRMSSSVAEHVACAIYDRFLERDDAEERLDDRLKGLRFQLEQIREEPEAASPTRADAPTLDWNAYVGRFEHPGWGTIVLYRDPEGITGMMGPLSGRLEPVAGEEHSFVTSMFRNEQTIRFHVDGEGHTEYFVLGNDETYRRVD